MSERKVITDEEVRKNLSKKFPKTMLKKRKLKGGMTADYIEGNQIIRRLNDTFGGEWEFQVVDKTIDFDNNYILVLGELRVPITTGRGDGYVSRQQWGGHAIQRYSQTKAVLDLGNDMKAATTDALKKCATMLGVALYLYGEDEVELSEPATGKVKMVELTADEKDSIPGLDDNKPSTKLQHDGITKVLDKKKIKIKEALDYLAVKKISELSYNEAALFLTGKHDFWKSQNKGK